jgi:flagellar biosynthetic protein FliR
MWLPGTEDLLQGFLIIARISAFMSLAPFFSIKGTPPLVRVALGVFSAALLLPIIQMVDVKDLSLGVFMLLLIKEIIIGIILGFVSMLTFTAIRVAGELVDIQMGFAMAKVFDPQNMSRITLVGQFFYFLGILLFLTINGHHSLIAAIYRSYELIPIQDIIIGKSIVIFIIKTFVGMFALGFKISAPFVAVLFISDIVLGLIARTVPQLNVFILGFPIKAGLGMIAIALALPVLSVVLGNILTQMEKDLVVIMEHLVP